MRFNQIPSNTPNNTFVFIECDITGKTKKTRYGVAKANVERNGGKYITNWGLAKLNNPMKNAAVREKVRQTNLERYGPALPMNSEEQIAKRQEQFNDKAFVAARTKKTKQTNIEKYGVDHIMRTEEGRAKVCETMIERHGVAHACQSPQIMANIKAGNLSKYGVENVAQIPEVQEKIEATMLARYGVSHYNQRPEMSEYLRVNCKNWLSASYANPWAKGIERPQEWNDKQRSTVAEKIKSGNWNGGYLSNCKGRYPSKRCKKPNPRFLSSLELVIHAYLDTNDAVEWYDYESIEIPYQHLDGSNHLYFPDFLVKYKNNDVMTIIETKTCKEKDSVIVQLKADAAVEYAKANNMLYVIMFDEDVEALGLDIDDIKQIEGITFQ